MMATVLSTLMDRCNVTGSVSVANRYARAAAKKNAVEMQKHSQTTQALPIRKFDSGDSGLPVCPAGLFLPAWRVWVFAYSESSRSVQTAEVAAIALL